VSGTYDIGLVCLSILIAIIASYTALDLAARVARSEGRSVVGWVLGGALTMGIGIWSMHFIGMLAFHLPIALAYDIPVTLGSVVPAVLASGLALTVIRRGSSSRGALLVSSSLIGLGIVLMHYSGMAALRMSPPIRYEPILFALSVLVAIVASGVAVVLALRLRPGAAAEGVLRYKMAAAVVMGLAIVGMHYTGMAAAQFDPQSMCLASPQGIEPQRLAVVIGGGVILIFLFTAAAAAFDATLQARATAIARGMTQELKRSHALLKWNEASAREAHEELERVIRSAPLAIYARDLDGLITSWNPAAEQMFGWRASEVLGRPLPTVPPGKEAESADIRRRTLGEEGLVHAEVQRRRRDGSPIEISSTLAPLRDAAGQVRGYLTIVADITERKRSESSLRLAARVFDSSNDGIVITAPDSTIVAVNAAFTRITGYAAEEAIGKTPQMLQSGWQDAGFYKTMWDSLDRNGYWRGEIWDRRKDGELYAQWTSISAVRDEHGGLTNYVAVLSDVTARKIAEERLDHLANHDPLTNLPNRVLFHERARQALARAARSKEIVAVLFLDVDNFKMINDTLGHFVGDLLLKETAQRLVACLRAQDTVARQGGDEFTILLESLADPDEAAIVAQKVLETLAQPYVLEGNEVFATASLGINLYPLDADNLEDLLKNADVAMYHAKEEGRNSYRFYSAQLNAGARERLALETALRKALDRDELVLHYQPQLDLKTGRVTGVEALLRWEHPERGLLEPERFISIAEATGLILPIGEWVLREACRQSRAWQSSGTRPLTVAVNLSARQFQQARFTEMIERVLRDTELEPRYLELELTESVLMRNIGEAASTLHSLRKLGVLLSIDDFGTGHSSLEYLKRFPVHKLKIDQSFVRGIPADPEDVAIARAIISLGHGLKLRVNAEGVENADQLRYLQAERCDEIQGFHLCGPIAADAVAVFVAGGGAGPAASSERSAARAGAARGRR